MTASDQEALTWAHELLRAGSGSGVASGVSSELLRDRPWSRTWRMEGPARVAFLKVTGPASHYEAELTHRLALVAPSFVPGVLGFEPQQGWLLLADAGPTLETRPEDGWRLSNWEQLVTRFAQLQRLAEPLVAGLIAADVPDERPQRLPAVLTGLLQRSPNLYGLNEAERARLHGLTPSWAADLDVLATLPVPASIQHGDLHPGNVSTDAAGQPVFLDFGDASIAHPFVTLLVPLLMAGRAGAARADAERIKDVYLNEFSDLAPRRRLRPVLAAALRLGWVSRASAWDRALRADPPASAGWGHPVPDALRKLLDR